MPAPTSSLATRNQQLLVARDWFFRFFGRLGRAVSVRGSKPIVNYLENLVLLHPILEGDRDQHCLYFRSRPA